MHRRHIAHTSLAFCLVLALTVGIITIQIHTMTAMLMPTETAAH